MNKKERGPTARPGTIKALIPCAVWKQGIHNKKWRENFHATALLFMT